MSRWAKHRWELQEEVWKIVSKLEMGFLFWWFFWNPQTKVGEKGKKKEEKGTVFSLKGYEWKWGIKEILPTGRESEIGEMCVWLEWWIRIQRLVAWTFGTGKRKRRTSIQCLGLSRF